MQITAEEARKAARKAANDALGAAYSLIMAPAEEAYDKDIAAAEARYWQATEGNPDYQAAIKAAKEAHKAAYEAADAVYKTNGD